MKIPESDNEHPFRRRRIWGIGLFLGALLIISTGGLLLFHHMAENPVIMNRKGDKSETQPGIAPLPGHRDNAIKETKPIETKNKTETSRDESEKNRPDSPTQPERELPSRKTTDDALTALIRSAKKHEENNDYTSAQTDYRKALKLEPESKTIRNELDRLNRKIADKRFEAHMSDGISAMQHGDYYTAQEAFIKAKNIRPASPEVTEALAEADAAIRLDLIRNLEQEAKTSEKSENWEHAVNTYHAVLKIDNTLQFAIRGKTRSLQRLRMDKRLQHYIENTESLQSDAYLKQAIELLEEAGAVEPKGPRIKAQLEKLKPLVQIARTPVIIIFKSDNLTEIAIYKVGKLGKFMQKEQKLRPGVYTVVGVRDGYKDVRHKITIKPEDQNRQIMVRCQEKI